MKTSNGIDVIRVGWFNHAIGTIGIVYGRDCVTGEIKAYLGPAFSDYESEDIDRIACKGAIFPPEAAAVIFGLSRAKADPAKKDVVSLSQ